MTKRWPTVKDISTRILGMAISETIANGHVTPEVREYLDEASPKARRYAAHLIRQHRQLLKRKQHGE